MEKLKIFLQVSCENGQRIYLIVLLISVLGNGIMLLLLMFCKVMALTLSLLLVPQKLLSIGLFKGKKSTHLKKQLCNLLRFFVFQMKKKPMLQILLPKFIEISRLSDSCMNPVLQS